MVIVRDESAEWRNGEKNRNSHPRESFPMISRNRKANSSHCSEFW